jgi:hypothetical protein
MTVVRRTYATWSIEWTRNDASGPYKATWTGYDSAADAQVTIDGAHADAGTGVVVEKRFTVDLDLAAPSARLYKPSNIDVPDVDITVAAVV